jgi:nucleoside-diphosphate-sugar epimerase
LPSNSSPLGALPARFRRPRLLVVGCGDVGQRVARFVRPGQAPQAVAVLALTSSPERVPVLRAQGIVPLIGNLDHPASLARLAGIATHVLHLAPPPNDRAERRDDPRTRALLRALRQRSLPHAIVYGSTSGVYGDCRGEKVAETRQVKPYTPRAWRRVDAERQLRLAGKAAGIRVHVLRIPGIYATDREGGTPHARLSRGTPVLRTEDDVYTNHIHADDLARASVAALWRGKPQRITHVSDDSDLKMGDYFDLAADLYGLARPRRLARAEAEESMPPMMMSFMAESRRLDNQRLKQELRVRLRYPTVREGLAEKP